MEYKLPERFGAVRIVSSEVKDGSMNQRDPQGFANILRFLEENQINKPLCIGGQPHQNKIIMTAKNGVFQNTDGILTKNDFVVAVCTADCLPMMISDGKKMIGAIHLSRHNLIINTISRDLAEIFKTNEFNPADTSVFFGPHIRVGSYKASEEFLKLIEGSKWAKYLEHKGDGVHFDLTRAATAELEEIGIKKDNIMDCAINTFDNENFFSFRRQNGVSPIPTFITLIFKK